jgi:hypothetical protein
MKRLTFTSMLLGSCMLYRLTKHFRKTAPATGIMNDRLKPSEQEPVVAPEVPEIEVFKTHIAEGAMARRLYAYDTSDHRQMLHVRFDRQTVDTLNKLKLATAVDMSKFVAFSVRHMLDTYPEFKTIITHYLQRTKL